MKFLVVLAFSVLLTMTFLGSNDATYYRGRLQPVQRTGGFHLSGHGQIGFGTGFGPLAYHNPYSHIPYIHNPYGYGYNPYNYGQAGYRPDAYRPGIGYYQPGSVYDDIHSPFNDLDY